MKRKLLHIGRFAALFLAGGLLAGCTVTPSFLGNSISGIGAAGTSKTLPSSNIPQDAVIAPGATGSIVPLPNEGDVVDLPYSSNQMQASASAPVTEPLLEEPLTPAQLHRRELINRGDLSQDQQPRAE